MFELSLSLSVAGQVWRSELQVQKHGQEQAVDFCPERRQEETK